MIEIARRSPFTGKVNTLVIPMTAAQYAAALTRWNRGAFLQDAFSTLPADLREFIKTGITPQELEELLAED
jgi:hypothetical protein